MDDREVLFQEYNNPEVFTCLSIVSESLNWCELSFETAKICFSVPSQIQRLECLL